MHTADFQELNRRVRDALGDDAGPEAHARLLERRMRVFAVLQTAELLFLIFGPGLWLKLLTGTLFAVYRARTVWTIIHDRVHRPALPNTPAKLYYDFSTGFIAHWWKRHHLEHHAHTNTARDPDLKLFFGRDMRRVLDPPRPPGSRWLGLLGTIAQYPLFFFLFFYRSLATFRGDIALYLVGIVGYGVFLAAVLPRPEAQLNTLLNVSVGTAYILFTFAPTHTASAANFALTGDPRADQYVATNDVWPERDRWSWFCGGINLHVEHHLFPGVPGHLLPRIVPIVRNFAVENGLPYHHFSPLSLWRAHLAFLRSF